MRKIKCYLGELNLTLLAYCLMPNHFHFLVRQDGDTPAGLLSQRVFNGYSKAYNKRYQHSGVLFQGPYRVKMVSDPSYLLHLCRYIHANPVEDGIVNELQDWPYSNYQEWVGMRGGAIVDRGFVHQFFPKPETYREFVMDYLRSHQLPEDIVEFIRGLEK